MTYREWMIKRVTKLHRRLTVRMIAKLLRISKGQVWMLLGEGLDQLL